MALEIVVLAAGQGTRMASNIPKVLHAVGGKPMLANVVNVAYALNPARIHVIIGHKGEQIQRALPDLTVNWIVQTKQAGTGHAVLQALPHIQPGNQVLVLSADVPLIQAETLQALVQCNESGSPLALLVAEVSDPTGLGRIVRNANQHIQAIVEERDANAQQRQIGEIYSGICCASAQALARWLPALSCDNAQGEYYLTEIIAMAVQEGHVVPSCTARDLLEITGVNDRLQLQCLERAWQARLAQQLMRSGVTLADANRIDIRGELQCEQDVFIDVNTVFEGQVVLGEGCRIGANCVLVNVTVAPFTEILPNSVLEGCQIGSHCRVGPFARLRPGTRLQEHCRVGNFVETKNAVFDTGSKASHLSYLGDVTLGKQVNIGAGTITCNYDGVNKHKTVIEDGVFVGSDTQLVAPVTVGKDATIGAGSTIRRDVPAGELTLTESRQKTVRGWVRPEKRVLTKV